MNWLCDACGTRYDGREVISGGSQQKCKVPTDGGGTCGGRLRPEYQERGIGQAQREHDMLASIEALLKRASFRKLRTGKMAEIEFATQDDLAEFAAVVYTFGGKVSGA
jgi:hypothetical protein